MSKKIIVTGANGQLGSEIKQLADSTNNTFIFIDIEDLDLSRTDKVMDFLTAQHPDFIINCAAYTAVDKAEENKEAAFLINARVPGTLAEYAKSSECKIIHISTDYVFSGDGFSPLKETDPTGPKSIYGQSKLEGEKALKNAPNSIIIRTSWLYSTFGNNFVKSMIRFFGEREELKIVFDQIGTPTYAADLAKAILSIIRYSDDSFASGIYHFSNEGVASWYDFAYEIKEVLNDKCRILPIETKDYPLPAPRPMYSVMNKAKIKEQFNLEIPHWKSSLRVCLGRMN